MPLPTPFASICSPSHITRAEPAVRASIITKPANTTELVFETELPKLQIERKYIRFEVFSSGKKVDEEPKEFNITVINRGNESVIKASSNETVLCAFERAGIEIPARCHTGECGFCRSKLIKGERK